MTSNDKIREEREVIVQDFKEYVSGTIHKQYDREETISALHENIDEYCGKLLSILEREKQELRERVKAALHKQEESDLTEKHNLGEANYQDFVLGYQRATDDALKVFNEAI